MNLEEIIPNIANIQNALKDGIETHNGFLMARALIGIKEEGAHVIRHHYTADGIEAEIWLPFDKKYYVINIKEIQHAKS